MKFVIYQDYLRVGGTESHTIHMADYLFFRQERCTIITNRPGGSLYPLVQEKGIPHVALQSMDTGFNWYAPRLLHKLKELEPDRILLMGRNANRWGSRLVKAFPNAKIFSSFRTGRKVPASYLRSMKHTHKTLVNSEYASEKLLKIGVPAEKQLVIKNPCLRAQVIDELRAKYTRSQMCAQLGVSDATFNMLYAGAFIPGKNHAALLRVMKEHIENPNLMLWMVGEGPLFDKMKRLAVKLGIEHRVRFFGYRSDLEFFYLAADLAVSPSQEESLPNFLIEAQYAGLPVVAYDEAGSRECFLPGKSGILVPRGNESEFSSAIASLYKSPEQLEPMSQAARQYALEQFEPNHLDDETYRILAQS